LRKNDVLLVGFNIHGYYSLALGYLKAYAVKDQVLHDYADIQIIDFCVDCNDVMQVLYYFTQMEPDVIGFSTYCWNMTKVLELTDLTKQVLPETKIILGGPEAGPVAEKYLTENSQIDIIVRGEAEVTFHEVLRFFVAKDRKLSDIDGISYRRNQKVFSNDDRALIENLDDIPSPYLSGILRAQDQATYLETYRGCPFTCAYCFEGKGFPKLRFFSEDRIKEEVKLITQDPSVRTFSFVDPVFNLNPKNLDRMSSIMDASQNPNARLHTIEINMEAVDEETAEKLVECKVASIETGPQTINEETLDNIKRKFDPQKFAAGIKLLLREHIKVLCDLMLGLPGDNFFRFLRSVRYIFDLKPNVIIFSTLHVIPGTDLYRNADKFEMKFDDQAPHYIMENYSFPFQQIRKAEIMADSMAKEYNLRLD
jgi:radical SAM superfamily enzyme YgiQ (UPF0313 family)